MNEKINVNSLFASVINETVAKKKSLREADELPVPAQPQADASQPPANAAANQQAAGLPPGTDVNAMNDAMKQRVMVSALADVNNISIENIIAKLNVIRAGKSFKDDKVKAQLTKYINALSPIEKLAMISFFKGIGQIVTGELPGELAIAPGNMPKPGITFAYAEKKENDQQGAGEQKPQVKPAATSSQKEKSPAPLPITPKI
jgi:hypothetical protein